MQMVLIGNYQPDKQESMERFARMLDSGFKNADVASEIWRPTILFGAWANSTTSGLGKWLGYLDKWMVFPLVLRWRLRNNALRNSQVRFHICDHSNAPYLACLPVGKSGITCHDVLAIRGALGYADAYCPASGLGKFLQKWILKHLSRARLLASVSGFTMSQLSELAPHYVAGRKGWRVIHNALNADFRPMATNQRTALLNEVALQPGLGFLLHVGSGQLRKNRRLLLDMVAALGSQWAGKVCFAGEAVDQELMTYAETLGLHERVVSVVKPDQATLVALYGSCDAFVFPSFSEGFGWPVIEAQACGAPVIASKVDPIPEVSGGAALCADPTNPKEFADAFLSLRDENIRTELIQRGFENASRFGLTQMMNAYLELHGLEQT